ncbi:MAG: hypothetical protein ACYCW6_15185 [Candidatus Xenobia bacterium]
MPALSRNDVCARLTKMADARPAAAVHLDALEKRIEQRSEPDLPAMYRAAKSQSRRSFWKAVGGTAATVGSVAAFVGGGALAYLAPGSIGIPLAVMSLSTATTLGSATHLSPTWSQYHDAHEFKADLRQLGKSLQQQA